MNIPDNVEVNEKIRRVKDFFQNTGYEAMVIGRQDNFSWFTCGGKNKLIITSETGFAILVITADKIFVVSQSMDGPRVLDEELKGLNFEPVFLRWYETSREEKVTELIKGSKTISDIPIVGAEYLPAKIYKLHYPLTDAEIEKCRWLGRKAEEIIKKIADEVKPGMSEHEVEAMFTYEYLKCDITPEVMLIGSDERIMKYRHPLPSDKKIERYLMLHPGGGNKWGLHVNFTRMVYFGDKLPDDISKKHEVACMIGAAAISMCVPGERFSNILKIQKQLYKEYGYEDEWKNHYHGGIIGYLMCDTSICMDPEAEVSVNEAYAWFVTITGAKVEELSINTRNGIEIPSITGKWPVSQYCYNDRTFSLPQILMK